jgi:nucleoside-diphosphate-sugar epimerase
MVTGAGGHLGGKAVEALASAPWCQSIVAVVYGAEEPVFSEAARRKLRMIRDDLTAPGGQWEKALGEVDAVIHFAAVNPVPDSSWDEAIASFDMTQNIGYAALRHGVRRMVFCSSNHVVGGYKDPPLSNRMGPGELSTAIPPAPGTRWMNGEHQVDSTPYAASKILGERCMAALAAASGGRLTTVSIRIGWALPGDNRATDVNLSGSPGAEGSEPTDEASIVALRWFRNMWLSNSDFSQLVQASLSADPASWPSPAVTVNGVSNNGGMDWSLKEGRTWLEYEPREDLFAILRGATS